MRDILQATEAESYLSFLTGSGNFRKKINPEYKANRKDKPLPIHLQACRQYLIEGWNSEVTNGYEADDALGMYQKPEETVICSLDKDLQMIPGFHYNWVKGEFTTVTELDGIKHFWKQMYQGDVADNLVGIRGIGPKKAARIVETEEDLFNITKKAYSNNDRFLMNAACFWIWRNSNETFLDLEWVKSKILQDKDLENSWQLLQQKREIVLMSNSFLG